MMCCRLLTGWLFPLNHQLLSFLKEKVLKGDAGDVILQVSLANGYFIMMMEDKVRNGIYILSRLIH